MVGSGFMDRKYGQGIPVTVFQHPKYFEEQDYDFSLLKLHKVLRFSERIQPIKMIEFGDKFPVGTNCLTSGWGQTEHGNLPKNLLAVNVAIANRTSCEKTVNAADSSLKITDRMICAGGGKEDSCFGTYLLHKIHKKKVIDLIFTGDSGGPFVCNKTLVGVVSFGKGCGNQGFPTVYASVASVTEWIQETMKN